MGVYIKGMEMPKNCMLCPLCVEEADPANGEMCMVTGTLMPPCTRERLDNCPLAPVPKHGRLIDADAIVKAIEADVIWKSQAINEYDSGIRAGGRAIKQMVKNAPTILEAEEGE